MATAKTAMCLLAGIALLVATLVSFARDVDRLYVSAPSADAQVAASLSPLDDYARALESGSAE